MRLLQMASCLSTRDMNTEFFSPSIVIVPMVDITFSIFYVLTTLLPWPQYHDTQRNYSQQYQLSKMSS
jgi:hypothetical protein